MIRLLSKPNTPGKRVCVIGAGFLLVVSLYIYRRDQDYRYGEMSLSFLLALLGVMALLMVAFTPVTAWVRGSRREQSEGPAPRSNKEAALDVVVGVGLGLQVAAATALGGLSRRQLVSSPATCGYIFGFIDAAVSMAYPTSGVQGDARGRLVIMQRLYGRVLDSEDAELAIATGLQLLTDKVFHTWMLEGASEFRSVPAGGARPMGLSRAALSVACGQLD
jgi:hypothetical protein